MSHGVPSRAFGAAAPYGRADEEARCLNVAGARGQSWQDGLGWCRLRCAWTVCALARRSGRPVRVLRSARARPYARVLVLADLADPSAPTPGGAVLDVVQAALRCAPGAHFTLLHPLDTAVEGYMRRAAVADHVIERHRRALRIAAGGAFRQCVRTLGAPVERFSLVLTPHPGRAALRVHAAEFDPDLVALDLPPGLLGAWCGLAAVQDALAATRCDLLVLARKDEQSEGQGQA